ncbi:MAG: lipoprotein insertase outer membrane protein LolB, partial [Oleibacter sp.]|nr:lipoprotein insertase outer membrane protein LolB [Thalassolituus sp.]
MNRHLLRCAALLCALLLSACASFRPQGGQETLQDQLGALSHWQVRGKMSVRTPDDSATGYLDWKQNGREFDMYIAGPLGQGATRLTGDANMAALTLPGWEGARYAESPEQLMQMYMGWNFPVSDIRYWVKGQASESTFSQSTDSANSTPAITTEYDDYGLLSQMTQHGWVITYSRYSQYKGQWLPGLVKMSGYDFKFIFSI